MALPIIEAFVVEKMIKEGGFGVVYLAKRVADKKIFAVKILHPHINTHWRFRSQFYREINLLTKLDHPYIIKVFGFLKGAPRAAMLMEYFESETLKTLLVNKSPLIEEKGIGVFRKLLEAYKYIHEHKIIHKDTKPENILVDDKGDVRVIDFSIAQEKSMWSFLSRQRREGTPLYMAPEQINKTPLDARVDIYALGATFYYVFSGRPHITASSEKALLQQQLKAPVPKMRQFNKKIPYQLDSIILRMLQKRPEERYQSAAEVLFDLNRFTTEDYLIKPGQVDGGKEPT